MQLTIDSNEPLDHVLEVVGSLYGVRLSATKEAAAAVGPSVVPRARKHGAGRRAERMKHAVKPASSGGGQRARRNGSAAIDTAVVRDWARSNGHAVSDRGRLPGAVVAAYTNRKRTRAR